MGFCPKNRFLKLMYIYIYIQRIYLRLLSTTFVKIHQIIYVIFETKSHFSQHNSSVSFQLKRYIFSTKVAYQSATFQTFHCSGYVSPNSLFIFQIQFFKFKSQFFFKVQIFFQCHERKFFCNFLAETLYAIDKSSTLKCNFLDLLLLALIFTKFLM